MNGGISSILLEVVAPIVMLLMLIIACTIADPVVSLMLFTLLMALFGLLAAKDC